MNRRIYWNTFEFNRPLGSVPENFSLSNY